MKTIFKKPTKERVNKAIELLLWRCRDARITEDKPKGHYGLNDWITELMRFKGKDGVLLLEKQLCMIQEMNTGNRDS